MGHIVTASGRLRETGHLRMRPVRNGKALVNGAYHRGLFFASHSAGVTAATYDLPKGQRIVVLSEAPFAHITAYQISKFEPVILAPGSYVAERKRGGCIYGR